MTDYDFKTDGLFGMKMIKKFRKIIAFVTVFAMVLSLALPTYATGVLITSDPVGGSCKVGESAPMLHALATAQSGGVLSYQWYDSYGAAIPGATGSSFAPPSSTAGEFGYYVTVTESVEGTVVATDTSGLANIKVTRDAETPKITANPTSASCTVGQTVTLYAKAEVATGNLTYRWYCYTAESAVGGATEIYTASSPSYAPPTDRASSVYYYCRITNTDTTANGETKVSVNSSTALVTVRNSGDAEAPVIYSQPENLVCVLGEEAQISVGATVSDGGDISYQWYSCEDEAGTNAVAIEGETTAYFRPATDAEAEMYVYCVLTNTNDTVTGNQQVDTVSNVVHFEVRKPDIIGAVWDGGSAGRFSGGSGTAADPFVIETAGQLGYLAELGRESGLSGQYFALGQDIILSDSTASNLWIPVGTAELPFEGNFDGRGYKIQGMKTENSSCAGLFGAVKNAEIRNVSVEGSVKGSVCGGIAGAAEQSIIENCVFYGEVSGSVSGGIAGTVFAGAVANCSSVGISPVGSVSGYALTLTSYDLADVTPVLSRHARAKSGLAIWTLNSNGLPGLTTEISTGDGEDIVSGDLSGQAGVSGGNAIAQMSVYGTVTEKIATFWVDPAELSGLVAEAAALAAENSQLSIYVYLDGGDAVSQTSGKSAELILGEDETALLTNAGSLWEKSVENGVPSWTEKSKGKGAALTVDMGDVNATWSTENLGMAVGASRIYAAFTSAGKSELAAADIGGYTNGTWRVKSDSFAGRTELVAVVLTSEGHTKYTVGVNSGGFAEFTSRGISATYLFYSPDSIPEEFKDAVEPPVTQPLPENPTDEPENPDKPAPRKGSTALVAAIAVGISVGGALIYGAATGKLGKSKNK